ncbi:glycosyltransferase family 2 protein [Paenibacillus sp. GXUN7292]|uniref:glycosyltransferase family 2 protein n=1 Tax=Paenibacillus sp. GXUN7292 TaxID=3422499 RepID=UPI003D7C5F44
MKPFFSIVVPVYNVEKYLEDCFQSIIDQRFDDYEILFINDGSTDSSGELCDNVCRKVGNAITLHKTNGGLSDARNVGITAARGEYIILLDSDDLLNSKALETLYELIVSNKNPDVVVNRIKFFSDDPKSSEECKYMFSEDLKELSIAETFQHLIKLDDYVPGAWTLVTKRSHIIDNDLYFVKGLLHEDEQWTPRTILKASSLAFNNNCLYLYRQGRNGSITQIKNVKREMDKLWTVQSLYKESKSTEYTPNSSIALLERSSDLYWGVLVRSKQYARNLTEYNKLLDELNSKRNIFKLSNNKKYVLCNVVLRIFGIKITSFILNKIVMLKE